MSIPDTACLPGEFHVTEFPESADFITTVIRSLTFSAVDCTKKVVASSAGIETYLNLFICEPPDRVCGVNEIHFHDAIRAGPPAIPPPPSLRNGSTIYLIPVYWKKCDSRRDHPDPLSEDRPRNRRGMRFAYSPLMHSDMTRRSSAVPACGSQVTAAGPPLPLRGLPRFDSCSSMAGALANCLRNRPFPAGGNVPSIIAPLIRSLNRLPSPLRRFLFTEGVFLEAMPERHAGRIDAERISRGILDLYPDRSYPAVAIGSSDGAAIHLCAAAGIPWLPHTVLVSIRRRLDPDDIIGDIAWGKNPAAIVTGNNPDLVVHQMHDPVQDRLHMSRIAMFRLKRRVPGAAFEHFLRTRLLPGGSILFFDCTFRWPVIRVRERHFFQVGGFGEISPGEYYTGGPRIAHFLASQKSRCGTWDTPGPDVTRPEGEWGTVREFVDSVEAFAAREGFRFVPVRYGMPGDLSPGTAELYESWYAKHGIAARRAALECFSLIDPWLTIATGSIPFWMVFSTDSSASTAERFIADHEKFDEILLTLIPIGIRGIGQTELTRWRRITGYARKRGTLLGIDPAAYPLDLAAFTEYHRQWRKVCRMPRMPPPLRIERLLDFLKRTYG